MRENSIEHSNDSNLSQDGDSEYDDNSTSVLGYEWFTNFDNEIGQIFKEWPLMWMAQTR